ncbi:MAG: sugar phosphate isomerase/epimerase [Clostridiales bacterium]|nr:sugar phosphate isomerase/epimerase [Clostridiales bacterium]
MKLGVLTVLYGNKSLDETLAHLKSLGVQSAEIGCGGYPGKAHCDPKVLLADKEKLEAFKATFVKHGIDICALAAHGNAVHPDKAVAKKFDDDFRFAVLLAEQLGVDTVITFSGCPGGAPEDKTPNWVTCAWPDDYGRILEYQWNEVLIPYWKEAAAFAKSHGVTKIAFEMHPGFCVYNPETLLRLRAAVGDSIGANFDPSHLIWQGIDPILAIRELRGAIYHFHAKDTRVDKYNTAKNGVLDTKSFGDTNNRSWLFRTVGFGNDLLYWRDMMSQLAIAGYDKVVSIEHEDALMSDDEGLAKAVEFLKQAMLFESRTTGLHWA